MTRSRTHRIWAWRDGVIECGARRTPAGAIKLFTLHDARAAAVAARVIGVQARHAYDGRTLLVPGIPEAANDDAALDALRAFATRAGAAIGRRVPARRFVAEVRP